MPMLNAHMQAASSHTVRHFSIRFLISYIVVITSPSSHIFKGACFSQQDAFEISLRALITPINFFTSSSSRGS